MTDGNPITIETERLILRRHRIEDAEPMAEQRADPAVGRYIGGPATAEASWTRLLRYAGHWTLFGYGYFAVEERASGLFVGDVGVAHYRRDGFVEPDGSAEVGWVLGSGYHGRGFGREATTALIDWVDATLPHPRTHCIIDVDHTASIRIAERLGYRRIETVTYHGDPVDLMVREKPA
jgi:RimJ/RimL family protein N-acetyltransferase